MIIINKVYLKNLIGNMRQFITWMDEYLTDCTPNKSWIKEANENLEYYYETLDKYLIQKDLFINIHPHIKNIKLEIA